MSVNRAWGKWDWIFSVLLE